MTLNLVVQYMAKQIWCKPIIYDDQYFPELEDVVAIRWRAGEFVKLTKDNKILPFKFPTTCDVWEFLSREERERIARVGNSYDYRKNNNTEI